MKPSVLYRCYDDADRLLYVGITMALPSRLTQHASDKPWWHEVHVVTVAHFADSVEAADREREAIATEAPIYNRTHTGKRMPRCRHADPVVEQMHRRWGERCRAAREALGISQRELARTCRVSNMTINRIEHGALVPNDDLKCFLAGALGCATVDELFPWSDASEELAS